MKCSATLSWTKSNLGLNDMEWQADIRGKTQAFNNL